MTIASEIVADWGSVALLTAILHCANARGPAFLSWSECVLGLCVCRGCVVGSQKHRSADSCSSVGVGGFQAGRADSQLCMQSNEVAGKASCKQASRQANKRACTQACTQARRQASQQARKRASTQARKQARTHARTQESPREHGNASKHART